MKVIRACFPSEKDRQGASYWYGEFTHNRKWHNKILSYEMVYEGSKPIGVTGYYSFKKGEFWLGWFGVIPSKRREGNGSKILKETIKKAKKEGATRFRIWGTDKKIESFYKRNDFRKIKPKKHVIIKGKIYYTYPRNTYFYSKKI